MAPLDIIGDIGNITANGNNNDPLETMMIHWSYYGVNGDNNASGNNGANDDNNCVSGVIGTNSIIEWRCLPHITMASMTSMVPMKTWQFIGAIGAIQSVTKFNHFINYSTVKQKLIHYSAAPKVQRLL